MTDAFGALVAGALRDPVAAVGCDGRIVWMNRAFAELAAPTGVGDTLDRVLEMPDEEIRALLRKARTTTFPQPFRAVLKQRPNDAMRGEHWRVPSRGTAIVGLRLFESEASRFLMLTEAIDRLNREIQSRRSVESSLREAIRDLEDANRTKERILAEVSHDLRTPLNAIIGFAEAMQHGLGGALSESQRDYVPSIHRSGLTLLDLVDRILDAGADEPEPAALRTEVVDLGDCIERCIAAVNGASRQKTLTFLTPPEPQLPRLLATQSTITTILMNLIDNAAKFSPDGGCITVDADRLSDGTLKLRITDQGPGIPPNEIDKVTLPFYRASPASLSAAGGHGLGLSLVASRVKAIGSTFAIQSQCGKGTAVTVSFPPQCVCWSA